jgi:hypothetical protein
MRSLALLIAFALLSLAASSCGESTGAERGADAGPADGASREARADARGDGAEGVDGADARVNAAPDAAGDRDGSIDTRDSGHDGDVASSRDASGPEAAPGDAAREPADAREAGPAFEVPPGYPAGPYGGTVGTTLPPLTWEGYASPDGASLARDQAHGSYTADDMRRSGKVLALIHFADFDCPGCRSGAADLAARGAELSSASGGAAIVAEVLVSKQYSSPATRSHLDAWVAAFDLTVTTVIDAPGHELGSLAAIGVRETAILVDLATMKIVWRRTGDLFGIQDSSVDFAATELLSRLPP